MADFNLARWLDAQLDRRTGVMSAADLSRRSRLREAHISQLRKGTVKGEDWETLTKLAKGFGMTRAQLVAAVDNQPLPEHTVGERTEVAIRNDPQLTQPQIQALLLHYETYVAPGEGQLTPESQPSA